MTGDDSPSYPDVSSPITEEKISYPDDLFFVPPPIFCDQLPPIQNYDGAAIIDNYDPSLKESVQNSTPEVIEDYDPRVNQED